MHLTCAIQEVAGVDLLEDPDRYSGEGTSQRSGTVYGDVYIKTGPLGSHPVFVCDTCTLLAPRALCNLQIRSATIASSVLL